MRIFGSLLVLAGCTSASNEPNVTVESEIQGGQDDRSNDAAVVKVMVKNAGGNSTCTGVLIAPTLVLTAAHCLANGFKAYRIGLYFDLKGAAYEPHLYEVIAQATAPTFVWSNWTCPWSTTDVGVVRLQKPVTEITPVSLGMTMPTVGQTCQTIGYGRYGEPPTGAYAGFGFIKRSATQLVTGVSSFNISTAWGDGIPDLGDSGGPLVCNGKVVGVTSCTPDGNGPNHRKDAFARIDTVSTWLTSIQATWGGWEYATKPPTIPALGDPNGPVKPNPPQSKNSCNGSCSKQAPDGCWCDTACVSYGDCCSDYKSHCSN